MTIVEKGDKNCFAAIESYLQINIKRKVAVVQYNTGTLLIRTSLHEWIRGLSMLKNAYLNLYLNE